MRNVFLKDLQKDTLVRIYMENGQLFQGSLQFASDEFVLLLTPLNEYIKIEKVKNIQAFSFVKLRKEKSNEIDSNEVDSNDSAKSTNLDTTSLVELHKMKAEEERKEFRNIVLRPTISTGEVNYGSQLHALQSVIKHTAK